MLPKKNKLTAQDDFGKVYDKGMLFSLHGITVRFIPNALSVSRVGFSIGKNFSKKAVTRNRVRRLLREYFHLEISRIKPGFDIVVAYGSKIKDPKLAEISQTLDAILKKCHLISQ